MPNRRKFLSDLTLVAFGSSSLLALESCVQTHKLSHDRPIVISTWANIKANEAAWSVLSSQGSALDAVEKGAKIPEADPEDTSVGYGGLPDRDGEVTLDACIMDMNGNCGSVCFLKEIKHPISVARKVMEDTPHVILAGEGALRFALSKGFKKENLLTEKARQAWEKWKEKSEYVPSQINNHDTIGILAIDDEGNISGACTTSGMGFKMKGRVGDSPIIGAGMYVDNEIGGAAATGVGEEVLKTLGSFLVVELMRNGRSPSEACKEAVMRIVKNHKEIDFQVGYIAINKMGQYGAYSLKSGFEYCVHNKENNQVFLSESYLDK